MARKPTLNKKELRYIDALVEKYRSHHDVIPLFRNQLLDAISVSVPLKPYIHTVKSRLKDPDHLKEKLIRKHLKAKGKGEDFNITPDNLLVEINDLVGIRILHLYTQQIGPIDKNLREIFHEGKYKLIEGPIARTWDDESRELFKSLKIDTKESQSLYTSVHYVVESASRTRITGEIQVRTLMEEVWGEVNHSINYPHNINSVACREQLAVLARVTSSATRLVDSIFRTVEDYKQAKQTTEKQTKVISRKQRKRK